MAGATFDIKRAQLLDLLEHFRFGRAVPSALLELHGVDPLRAQVGYTLVSCELCSDHACVCVSMFRSAWELCRTS